MKTVYAVYANGDMTEGHGPMQLVCIYDNVESAIQHIENASGVMGFGGEKAKYNTTGWYYASANSHEVREHQLLVSYGDRLTMIENQQREAALKKLSAHERKLLGLA